MLSASLSGCGQKADTARNLEAQSNSGLPSEELWDFLYPVLVKSDFIYPERLKPSILLLLYDILDRWERKPLNFNVHSDYRFNIYAARTLYSPSLFKLVKSQHYVGTAVDFRFSDYSGLSKRARLKRYYDDFRHLLEILKELGVKEMVGLGLYPNQNNPFFHLDTRGTKARWGRLKPYGPSTSSFHDTIRWIEARI